MKIFALLLSVLAFSSQVSFAAPATDCTLDGILNATYDTHFAVGNHCEMTFSKDAGGKLTGIFCANWPQPGALDELAFTDGKGRLTGKWHGGSDWGFIDFFFGNGCTEMYGVRTWEGGAGSWYARMKK